MEQLERLKQEANLDDQTDGIIETDKLEQFLDTIQNKKSADELRLLKVKLDPEETGQIYLQDLI